MAPALLQAASLLLRASSAICPASASCPADDKCTYEANGVSLQLSCATDYYGGDLQLAQTSTLTGCMSACATTTGCVAVSYVGHNCYMKSTLNAAQANDNVIGAAVVSRDVTPGGSASDPSACPASYTCPENDRCTIQGTNDRTFALSCGKDFYGGDFDNLGAASLEVCTKACANNAQCVAASFVGGKGAGHCYLKDRNNGAGSNYNVDAIVLVAPSSSSSASGSATVSSVATSTTPVVISSTVSESSSPSSSPTPSTSDIATSSSTTPLLVSSSLSSSSSPSSTPSSSEPAISSTPTPSSSEPAASSTPTPIITPTTLISSSAISTSSSASPTPLSSSTIAADSSTVASTSTVSPTPTPVVYPSCDNFTGCVANRICSVNNINYIQSCDISWAGDNGGSAVILPNQRDRFANTNTMSGQLYTACAKVCQSRPGCNNWLVFQDYGTINAYCFPLLTLQVRANQAPQRKFSFWSVVP